MRQNLRPRTLLAVSLFAAASACGSTPTFPPIVGTYLATTFLITPTGEGTTNVLAEGGTLGLNVANNFVTAGTLIIPATINDGTTFTASLAGTAAVAGNTVTFTTFTASFVRELTFTLAADSLMANQTVADTTFDIVLRRQ